MIAAVKSTAWSGILKPTMVSHSQCYTNKRFTRWSVVEPQCWVVQCTVLGIQCSQVPNKMFNNVTDKLRVGITASSLFQLVMHAMVQR
jgi:hypothetical protein